MNKFLFMNDFKNLGKTVLAPLFFLFIILSCTKDKTPSQQPSIPSLPGSASDVDLKALPKDVGGVQTPVYLSNGVVYGHYIYTPSGYNSNQAYYPLLVYLHGSGDSGNSRINQGALKRVLNYGPPELINKKLWSPTYPMIVVSPQEVFKTFAPDSIHEFIKYIVSTYRINTHRIYLTGLSMGGISAYYYLSKYAKTGFVAASVPMSVRFDINHQPDTSNLVNFPIWTFCGGADAQVQQSINIVNAINQLHPTLKAKLTIFPGVGHNCWDLAYSGSGIGKESKSYDAFNMDIYDWMFQYAR